MLFFFQQSLCSEIGEELRFAVRCFDSSSKPVHRKPSYDVTDNGLQSMPLNSYKNNGRNDIGFNQLQSVRCACFVLFMKVNSVYILCKLLLQQHKLCRFQVGLKLYLSGSFWRVYVYICSPTQKGVMLIQEFIFMTQSHPP